MQAELNLRLKGVAEINKHITTDNFARRISSAPTKNANLSLTVKARVPHAPTSGKFAGPRSLAVGGIILQ